MNQNENAANRSKLLLSAVLMSVALVLFNFMEANVEVWHHGNVRYLNGAGLAAREWGTILSAVAVAHCFRKVQQAAIPILDVEVPHDNGCGQHSVAAVFHSKSWKASMVVLVSRAAFNLLGTFRTFITLPPRDPMAVHNESLWQVCLLELPVLLCCFAGLCESVFRSKKPKNAADWLRSLANFSALKTLPEASPGRALASGGDVAQWLRIAVMGTLSVVALISKMQQLPFVASTPASWTASNYLTLAMFINNIAGIDQRSEAQIQAALMLVHPTIDEDDFRSQWLELVGQEAKQCFGFWKAFVCMATMDLQTVRALLNESAR